MPDTWMGKGGFMGDYLHNRSLRSVTVLLFLSFFLLYLLSLAVSPRPFAAHGFFGSDDMSGAYRGHPPRSFIAKHPLFYVAEFLYLVGSAVFSPAPPTLAYNLSMAFPMAILGGAAAAIAYLVFLRNTQDPAKALPFTVLYGVSACMWLYSSLPEAYVLITVCSNLVLLSVVTARLEKSPGVNRTALLNALSCFASPQQIFLSIVPAISWLRESRFSVTARRAVQYGAVFTAAYLVPYEMYLKLSGMGWRFGPVYLRVYANPHNLVNLHWLAVITVNFLLFSVVAPAVEPRLYTEPALSIFRTVPWEWIVLAGLFLVFCALSFRGFRREQPKAWSLALPLGAYLLVYLAFFLYFNPSEAYLYVLPALLPWLLILQTGFCAEWSAGRRAALWLLIAAVAVNSLHFRLYLNSLR